MGAGASLASGPAGSETKMDMMVQLAMEWKIAERVE
jgi:hypothetical protein